MATDFIPDSEFVPDADQTAPVVHATEPVHAASSDFIPDSEFVSDEDKYGSLGQQVAAGAEGVARGATFGVSDLLERGAGIPAADIAGRAEENPTLAGTGSLAGGAAALYLTGGAAGLAAKLGLGELGTAAKLAAMGVEGGAFGLGNSISEAAMGDPSLNAQKIISNIGTGAALGVGLGGLGKLAETGLPKVAPALTKLVTKAQDLAGKIGTEEQPGLVSAILPDSWAAKINEGLRKGDISFKNVASAVSDLAESDHADKAMSEQMRRILLDAEKSGIPTEHLASYLAKEAQNAGLSQEQFMSDLKPYLKEPLSTVGRAAAAGEISDIPENSLKEAGVFKEAQNKIRFMFKDGVLSHEMLAEDLAKPTGSVAAELVSKAAALDESLNNVEGNIKGAQSISDKIEEGAKEGTKKDSLAAALSPTAMYAAHLMGVPSPIIAAGKIGLEAANLIRNPTLIGENLASTFQKMKAIGELVDKTTKAMNSGAKAIFANNVTRGAIEQSVTSLANYDKKADRIQQLAQDPQMMVDHTTKATSGIYNVAPKISQGIQGTLTNAVQFLNSKRPQPQSELPLSAPYAPTESQKAKFNRYYEAVNNPVGVLKQIKQGTLSNETMEALHAVHPELLQEMQHEVMANMSAKKAQALPYGTKIALSKFMGHPLEESLQPQVMAANQATFAIAQQPMAQKGNRSTQSGMSKLKVGSRAATETQKQDEK